MDHQAIKALKKHTKGPCRPSSGEIVRGVYDDLLIPADVHNVSFGDFGKTIILGSIVVRGHGSSGDIYRPNTRADFAQVADDNPTLRIIRKPPAELAEMAEAAKKRAR